MVCKLCPRECGVDRDYSYGFCGVGNNIKIARAALHYWEEPCISGENGSGTIFFSGCSLGCEFCQNSIISHKHLGKEISSERLCDIFFELKEKGANNINLVTADHYLHKIIPVLDRAKRKGLDLPIILNTSSYLKSETLSAIAPYIDIYIADLKFFNRRIADKYASAPNYPEIAKNAICDMVKYSGPPVYNSGILKRGVIVRLLVLPSNLIDAKQSLKYLHTVFGNDIIISLMSQYTPMECVKSNELKQPLSHADYLSVVKYAQALNMSNVYTQENSEGREYIPDFDLQGVDKC